MKPKHPVTSAYFMLKFRLVVISVSRVHIELF